MSAPEPQSIAFQIAQWALGLLAIAFGWLWRELSAKASKDELAEAVRALKDQHEAMLERVDEHYEDATRSREALYKKFDDLNRTLGATMVSLSRLQGQLDRSGVERRGPE